MPPDILNKRDISDMDPGIDQKDIIATRHLKSERFIRHAPRDRSERYHCRQTSEIRETYQTWTLGYFREMYSTLPPDIDIDDKKRKI